MGGATSCRLLHMSNYTSFNRRGDSLGGATRIVNRNTTSGTMFQSQRRFFGGSNELALLPPPKIEAVSIAEAILWGEQPNLPSPLEFVLREFQSQRRFFGGSNQKQTMKGKSLICRFNRRGDSLGGATKTYTTLHKTG